MYTHPPTHSRSGCHFLEHHSFLSNFYCYVSIFSLSVLLQYRPNAPSVFARSSLLRHMNGSPFHLLECECNEPRTLNSMKLILLHRCLKANGWEFAEWARAVVFYLPKRMISKGENTLEAGHRCKNTRISRCPIIRHSKLPWYKSGIPSVGVSPSRPVLSLVHLQWQSLREAQQLSISLLSHL